MSNPILKATVKETNQPIEVYRRKEGGFVDWSDCKTVYQKKELIFSKN
jgi:hypothetical protein